MDALLVVSGLVLLVIGGEGLVRGACGWALGARLTPSLVGLTIVAAGTSMPELVVSVQAALAGNVGISVGNVVGSNIFNIGAILGLAALIRPLRVVGTTLWLDAPIMLVAALLTLGLVWNGHVGRAEGGLLTLAMVLVTVVAVAFGASEEEEGAPDGLPTASFGATGRTAFLYNGGAVVLGAGLLAAGSSLLVKGAVGIAAGLGVSEATIGLTIVAAGTSTPELVTSLVAARAGRDDIAIANVVGSNIFNVLGILGVTALVQPLMVPDTILARDVWWMLALSAALIPILWTGHRIDRMEGGVLLTGFGAYLAAMVLAGA